MAPVTVISDIQTAATKGRMFTDARNALVAYAVIVEGKSQSELVSATGLDKGDVSRVVKQAKAVDGIVDILNKIVRTGIETRRMESAAGVGAIHLRRAKKVAPVKSTPEAAETEAEESAVAAIVKSAAPVDERIADIAAAVHALAGEVTDKEAERLEAALVDALRQAKIARARRQAGKAAR